MTTYVWHGVFMDYTAGMAAVEADSVQDAYDKVREDSDIPDHMKGELLNNEPQPADGIEWVYGGA